MNEENTRDLSDSEKLNLILAELAEMRDWRGRVDAFIEERSRETRPLLGQIQKDIADTRFEMRERFEKVEAEIADTRTEMRERFEKVDERFNGMEEQLALVRDDAKLSRRTTKVIHDELLRARTEWEENREDLEKLESRVEKLEAA